MKKRWVVLNEEKDQDLRQVLLKNRKVEDPDSFFQPHLYKLTAPDKLFSELDLAVERIKKAIKEKELIYIYGDFDVDGIAGTAILWETIDFLGGKVLPYIPHREKEGYGLHPEALKSLAGEGAKVVITVDCGIAAAAEAKIAKKLGVDLIITDHHTKQPQLPEAFAILHAEKLAGSGVAFMVAKALLESFSKRKDEQLFKNLELASLGTIADIVPLTGDNRIITANGLHNLASSSRIGLRALYEAAALNKKIGTYEVGFIIAPRLNAAGRMEHALDSLRLLLTRKKERARQLAAKLSQTNEKRQEALKTALEHARGSLPSEPAKMIIVHHESYPQGVIGLVAGKLVDEFYRPSLAISETKPISKGSARSVSGFNIVEAIGSAKELLVDHGGHPMAAGFSIEHKNLPYFKNKMLEYAAKNLKDEDLVPSLKIDCNLNSGLLNPKTLELVREFEPFGVGNPEPTFVTENLEVADARTVGNEGKHLRLVLRTPNHFVYDAIGFGLGGKNVAVGDRLDAAYTLSEDTWRGDGRLELKIKDLRSSKS